VRGAAVPLLADNRIEGNGGAGVTLPGPERADEVFRWNSFTGLTREQAVRFPPAPRHRHTPASLVQKIEVAYDPAVALDFFKSAGKPETFAAGAKIFAESERAIRCCARARCICCSRARSSCT